LFRGFYIYSISNIDDCFCGNDNICIFAPIGFDFERKNKQMDVLKLEKIAEQ
jgi:hypothetical protein